jgi:hypothetical protein
LLQLDDTGDGCNVTGAETGENQESEVYPIAGSTFGPAQEAFVWFAVSQL